MPEACGLFWLYGKKSRGEQLNNVVLVVDDAACVKYM